MKILVFADIHGEFEKLSNIIDSISKETIKGIDVIVCPGDFTDMFSVPKEFSQEDVADMVLQRLVSLNKPMLCIPGNHDPYSIVGVFEEYGVGLHNRTKKVKGMLFAGWGGAATPFDTIFEPSEEETAEALSALGSQIKEKFVLVVHNPPKGTKADQVQTGEHVGSDAVREFIINKQPLLSISAHIHEAGGIDKLGKTTLFNPGPVFNGNYGVVDIEGDKIRCRIGKA